MTALSILRLLPDSGRVTSGRVDLDGTDLTQLPEARMRDIRGRRISIIFQEPSTSLNPVMPVGRQITEVIERHTALAGVAARAKAVDWLRRVGIPEPERRVDDYPFQLSGGQKQRVMIAIALAAEPDILIADEPTTALDVTIQAQILDLLRELQAAHKLAMLLITHDLAIVAQMAHRVALMYAGEIVEVATAQAFFAKPLHPYAVNLFEALPDTAQAGPAARVDPGHRAAADPGISQLSLRGALHGGHGSLPRVGAAAARRRAATTRCAACCTNRCRCRPCRSCAFRRRKCAFPPIRRPARRYWRSPITASGSRFERAFSSAPSAT